MVNRAAETIPAFLIDIKNVWIGGKNLANVGDILV